jgi:cation transport ATPase
VSVTAPNTGFADFLTRTTLEIDGGLSALAIDRVTSALRHVPGVLLTEVSAASARVFVAHDPGVSSSALLAATEKAGLHATILAPPPSSLVTSAPTYTASFRRRIVVAAACLGALALVNVVIHAVPGAAWLFPILVSGVWLFYLASMKREV